MKSEMGKSMQEEATIWNQQHTVVMDHVSVWTIPDGLKINFLHVHHIFLSYKSILDFCYMLTFFQPFLIFKLLQLLGKTSLFDDWGLARFKSCL